MWRTPCCVLLHNMLAAHSCKSSEMKKDCVVDLKRVKGPPCFDGSLTRSFFLIFYLIGFTTEASPRFRHITSASPSNLGNTRYTSVHRVVLLPRKHTSICATSKALTCGLTTLKTVKHWYTECLLCNPFEVQNSPYQRVLKKKNISCLSAIFACIYCSNSSR